MQLVTIDTEVITTINDCVPYPFEHHHLQHEIGRKIGYVWSAVPHSPCYR